jgi:PAS domain S-box-containing protein
LLFVPMNLMVTVFDNPELFQQLVDLLPFGVYVADGERRIRYWNQRAAQITGYLAQEVVGRSCAQGLLEHCTPSGSGVCDSAHCPLGRVLRDGQAAESRLLLRHKQGHRVPVLVRAIGLRDGNGKITAVAEVFREETVGPSGLCWVTENIDRFDPQMGLPSVSASRAQLRLSLSQEEIYTAVFVIEIENLLEMATRRGHEMTNVGLRALGQTVSRLLTMPHYLGCWPDSRLLAVVPHCHRKQLDSLTKTLEEAGSCCNVMWWGERVTFRVKVISASIEPKETFESLMARLTPPIAVKASGTAVAGDM